MWRSILILCRSLGVFFFFCCGLILLCGVFLYGKRLWFMRRAGQSTWGLFRLYIYNGRIDYPDTYTSCCGLRPAQTSPSDHLVRCKSQKQNLGRGIRGSLAQCAHLIRVRISELTEVAEEPWLRPNLRRYVLVHVLHVRDQNKHFAHIQTHIVLYCSIYDPFIRATDSRLLDCKQCAHSCREYMEFDGSKCLRMCDCFCCCLQSLQSLGNFVNFFIGTIIYAF